MTESWVDKHRPNSFSDVQGNNKALRQIQEWADNWSPGGSPILLVGPPGTGKTTTAYLLADYFDCPLNQINASSARKSEDIKAMASAMRSSPAETDKQLVLLDEVDNWHHAANKTPLVEALKDARNPTVLTANDEYETPESFKRYCDTYEFKLGKRSRKAKLREIAEQEGVDLDAKDLDRLADRPDLRSAINDLQTWSEHDQPPGADGREWDMNDFSVVESLLRHGGEWKKAMTPQSKGFDPAWALMWADENVSQEFRGLEAGVAYDLLSRADMRVSQGYDSQARGFPYAGALLSQLPATRLSEPYGGYISVNFPSWVQSSEASPGDGSPAAALYNAIVDERGYQLAGSFAEFKAVYLPILQDLPTEERYELALNHGLDEKAMEALNVDEDEFEEWAFEKEPEAGEWSPDTGSAADW